MSAPVTSQDRRIGVGWPMLIFGCALMSLVVVVTGPVPDVAFPAAMTWLVVPFLAAPMMSEKGSIPVAHPYTIVLALVIYGWVLRLTLAAFDARVGGALESMLFGKDASILLDGVLLGGTALLALLFGYAAAGMGQATSPVNRAPSRLLSAWDALDDPRWRQGRLTLVSVVVLSVALLGIYLMYQAGGGLIGKRFNDLEGGSANRTGSLTYLYLRMSYLAHSVFIVLLCYRLKFRRFPGLTAAALFPISAAAAVLGPFMSDSRAGVAVIVLDVLLLQSVIRGRLYLGRMLATAMAVLVFLGAMLGLRTGSSGSLRELVTGVLIGRDLFDIGKLSHIAQLQPGQLGGQTLWGWLVFPIPQSLLPFEKPMWAELAPFVWQDAYGASTGNSIPASLPGELYLNGGYIAVIGGMFAFGLLLKISYDWLKPQLTTGHLLASVLFCVGFVRLIIFGLSNDLGTGILSSLSDVLPIVAILTIARRRERVRGSSRRAARHPQHRGQEGRRRATQASGSRA